jgi:uncharacterized protein (DUF3084 family)
MRLILRQLEKAAGDDKLLEQLEMEELAEIELENTFGIMKKQLQQKEQELENKNKTIEAKDKTLEAKDKALEAKDKALEAKDKALEEKEKMIQELLSQLKKS